MDKEDGEEELDVMEGTGEESTLEGRRPRHFTYQTFTQRVNALRFDFVATRPRDSAPDAQISSYYCMSKDRWRDLNLSRGFCQYLGETDRVSQSLHQVVFHKDDIAQSLLRHLSPEDAELHSAEPLLDLLCQLARDLQSDFMPYWPQCIETLQRLALSKELSIVEWTFNALAHLFKTLRKQLVPRLAETFSLMVGLLGKTCRRKHVIRFAGEALSYLVRHAPESNIDQMLALLHQEMADDGKITRPLRYGALVLLSESAKSPAHSFHRKTWSTLARTYNLFAGKQARVVPVPLFTALVRHADNTSVAELQNFVLHSARDESMREAVLHMIFLLFSVNKALVIEDPEPFISICLESQGSPNAPMVLGAILSSVSPLYLAKTIDQIWVRVYESFGFEGCLAVGRCIAEWNSPCFRSQVAKKLTVTLNSEKELKEFTPYQFRLIRPLIVEHLPNFVVPHELQSNLLSLERYDLEKTLSDASSDKLESFCMDAFLLKYVKDATKGKIAVHCLRTIVDTENAGLGLVVSDLLTCLSSLNAEDTSLILKVALIYADSPVVLEAFGANLSLLHHDTLAQEYTTLVRLCSSNLLKTSQALRSATIKLFFRLHTLVEKHASNILGLCVKLDTMSIDPRSMREAGMVVRNISSLYNQLSDTTLKDAVPRFLYGQLFRNITPLWDVVCDGLSDISKLEPNIVLDIAFYEMNSQLEKDINELGARATENADAVGMVEDDDEFMDWEYVSKPANLRESFYLQIQSAVVSPIPVNESLNEPSRLTQNLRLLLHIPNLAERRTQILSPMLLAMNSGEGNYDRENRSQMLKLYAKFNARSIYMSDLIYKSLYESMSSGDGAIQRLSLDAIYSWKVPEIMPYREHLDNLLNESTQRDELTNFLVVDDKDSVIEDGHLAKVMEYVMALLYGQLISRKHSGSKKKGQQNRRNVILDTLRNVRSEHLSYFVSIMMKPFDKCFKMTDFPSELELAKSIAPRRTLGFVAMAESLVDHLAYKLSAFAQPISSALLLCLITSSDYEDKVISKSVRQSCLRTFVNMYDIDYDWSTFTRMLFEYYISKRLDRFAEENSQGVSVLHRLFYFWSSDDERCVNLYKYDDRVTQKVIECFGASAVQKDVIQAVLDYLDNLTRICIETEYGESNSRLLIVSNMDTLLKHFAEVLKRNDLEIIEMVLRILNRIAPLIVSGAPVQEYMNLLFPLLNRALPLSSKVQILGVLKHFITLDPSWLTVEVKLHSKFDTLVYLFSVLREEQDRESLLEVMASMGKYNSSLALELLVNLNATSRKRLGPDYTTRISAFSQFNQSLWNELSLENILAVMYNALFFINDIEELSIRSSASLALRKVVDRLAKENEYSFLRERLLPRMKKNLNSEEPLRYEACAVISHMVEVADMGDMRNLKPLLLDDEANFFYNILHIQVHRRERAVRRLRALDERQAIQSKNVSQILIPLLSHNIYASATPILRDESIQTLTRLCLDLSWPQFRSIFSKQVQHLADETAAKAISSDIKLITGMCTTLEVAMGHGGFEVEDLEGRMLVKSIQNDEEAFQTSCVDSLLGPLSKQLELKDTDSLTRRIPLALPTIRLVMLLPNIAKERLPNILLNIVQILKSRAQDVRNSTREVLAKIAERLGPDYFSFLLTELSSTLTRGYQKHVLGHVVHSMLCALQPSIGSLDDVCTTLSELFLDDIAGSLGAEKDEEDYVSKMKEVRSTKSYDSYERLAAVTSTKAIGSLLSPVFNFLHETENSKTLRKIEEILRHVTRGLMMNRPPITFCLTLFREIERRETRPEATAPAATDEKDQFFVVPSTAAKRADKFAANSKYAYRFALDLTYNVLRKESVGANSMADLIPVVGNCVMKPQLDVKVSALKCYSELLQAPDTDATAGVFFNEAMSIMRDVPDFGSEQARACLKFVTTCLKERPDIQLDESSLAYLLKRVSVDIHESERQGTIFALLRVVLSKRIQMAEVYEVMDLVRDMMITNQSPGPRATARQLYMRFLTDYPQSRKRLQQQIMFLCQNLEYEYASGRESVLEALNSVVISFGDELFNEFCPLIFVALAMCYAGDDNVQCRELAAMILKQVLERVDEERYNAVRESLRAWSGQAHLVRCAYLVYGLIFEKFGASRTGEVDSFLAHALETWQSATVENWESTYTALIAWEKLANADDQFVFQSKFKPVWLAVNGFLFMKHTWIKLVASRLLGLQFSGDHATGMPNGTLIAIMFAHIDSPHGNEAIATQAVKNLVFLSRRILEQDAPASDEAEVTVENGYEDVVDGESSFLPRRERQYSMRRILSQCQAIMQRKHNEVAIVKLITVLIHVMSHAQALANAESIIHCFYLSTEHGSSEEIASSEEQQAALQMLQEKIGTDEYVRVFGAVRQQRLDIRSERRYKRAIEAVSEPELAARKKQHRHQRYRENKKRKLIKDREGGRQKAGKRS